MLDSVSLFLHHVLSLNILTACSFLTPVYMCVVNSAWSYLCLCSLFKLWKYIFKKTKLHQIYKRTCLFFVTVTWFLMIDDCLHLHHWVHPSLHIWLMLGACVIFRRLLTAKKVESPAVTLSDCLQCQQPPARSQGKTVCSLRQNTGEESAQITCLLKFFFRAQNRHQI